MWLQNSIQRLTVQVDKMESELESVSSRKKKLDRDVSPVNRCPLCSQLINCKDGESRGYLDMM